MSTVMDISPALSDAEALECECLLLSAFVSLDYRGFEESQSVGKRLKTRARLGCREVQRGHILGRDARNPCAALDLLDVLLILICGLFEHSADGSTGSE